MCGIGWNEITQEEVEALVEAASFENVEITAFGMIENGAIKILSR